MNKYPFQEYARVVILSSVVSVSAPTVPELNGGLDATCDLVISGLTVARPGTSITHELWAEDRIEEEPDRYSVRCELEGFRFKQPLTEPLYEACATFRAPVVLVARYGVPFDTAWTAGQVVDVVVGRWGKRQTAPSASNQAVTFSVPILVTDDDDAATVAA